RLLPSYRSTQLADTLFQHFRLLVLTSLSLTERESGILVKHWALHRRGKPDVDFANACAFDNRKGILDSDSAPGHDGDAATSILYESRDRLDTLQAFLLAARC